MRIIRSPCWIRYIHRCLHYYSQKRLSMDNNIGTSYWYHRSEHIQHKTWNESLTESRYFPHSRSKSSAWSRSNRNSVLCWVTCCALPYVQHSFCLFVLLLTWNALSHAVKSKTDRSSVFTFGSAWQNLSLTFPHVNWRKWRCLIPSLYVSCIGNMMCHISW